MVVSYSAVHVNSLHSVWICFLHLHFLAHKRKNTVDPTFLLHHSSRRISTRIPRWVRCNCCLIAHSNTMQEPKTGCERGNIVCSWKDKGSQCQQMQLPDGNFGQGGQGKLPFKKCHGTFNAPESLQLWHHILFRMEYSGALTLCGCINPVLSGGCGWLRWFH